MYCPLIITSSRFSPLFLSLPVHTLSGADFFYGNRTACKATSTFFSRIAFGQTYNYATPQCSTNPTISSISFAAVDPATAFRVYTTWKESGTAAGTGYYQAASSTVLTSESVTCYQVDFNQALQAGAPTALVGMSGQLYVNLYCDAQSGCEFYVGVTSGCTNQVTTPNAIKSRLDECMNCGPHGFCPRVAPYTCICSDKYSGTRCEIPPMASSTASASGSSQAAGSSSASAAPGGSTTTGVLISSAPTPAVELPCFAALAAIGVMLMAAM